MTLEGMPLNASEHPLSIVAGYSWMGYPLIATMSVAEALSGFNAVSGDKIMSQSGSTTSYSTRWRGQLSTFTPGKGYIFNSASPTVRTLVFPMGAKKATPFNPMGK